MKPVPRLKGVEGTFSRCSGLATIEVAHVARYHTGYLYIATTLDRTNNDDEILERGRASVRGQPAHAIPRSP
jgi:hypothetical protein